MGAFLLAHLAPGDPLATAAGDGAAVSTPAHRNRLRAQYGLDKPLWIQYARWASRASRGDLGRSISLRRPVIDLIQERLPASLLLMGSALLFSLMLGISLGVGMALRPGRWIDRIGGWVTTLALSAPSVWVGLMLIHVFAVQLQWLPSGGMSPAHASVLGLASSEAANLWSQSAHFVLPVVTLSLAQLAVWARYQRASLVDALRGQFVRTARAKGLRERTVVLNHGLRNALLPTVTLLGTGIGALVEGSYIVETVFSWPGLGRLSVEAIQSRDYPLVLGLSVTIAVFVVIGNLLADIAYGALDPRLRVFGSRPQAEPGLSETGLNKTGYHGGRAAR